MSAAERVAPHPLCTWCEQRPARHEGGGWCRECHAAHTREDRRREPPEGMTDHELDRLDGHEWSRGRGK